MKPTEKLLINMFLLIVLCFSVFAEEQSVNVDLQGVTDVIYREEIKTRTELKNYIDTRVDELSISFEEKGQRFVNQNFKVAEERITSLAKKLMAEIILTAIVSILFSLCLMEIIKRRIDKIQRRKIERKKEIQRQMDIKKQQETQVKPVEVPKPPFIIKDKDIPVISPEEAKKIAEKKALMEEIKELYSRLKTLDELPKL